MTIHRPGEASSYQTESLIHFQHNYESDALGIRGSALRDLKLPALKELNLLGLQSEPYRPRNSMPLALPLRQPAIFLDTLPTASPPILSRSSPDASFVPICPDSNASGSGHKPDRELDDNIAAFKGLAVTPKPLIILQFGECSALELRRIRADVDPDRPLFNSDMKKAKEPGSLTNKKTAKHCEVERERRAAHQIMQQELGKRIPNAIMELTNYKSGTAKGPGKNTIFVAAILLHEFDTLLQEKQRAENEELHRQVREQAQALSLSRSARRHSPVLHDDVCRGESSRKRKWLPEPATAVPGGSMDSADCSEGFPEIACHTCPHQEAVRNMDAAIKRWLMSTVPCPEHHES